MHRASSSALCACAQVADRDIPIVHRVLKVHEKPSGVVDILTKARETRARAAPSARARAHPARASTRAQRTRTLAPPAHGLTSHVCIPPGDDAGIRASP
jgi:hypothetical protein